MKYYFLIFILLLSSVYGLGVATDYLENNELVLAPGESHILNINVQNADENNVTVQLKVESEVASPIGNTTVTIPADYYDAVIPLNITVPQDAEDGRTYAVDYSVKPIGTTGSQVFLNLKISKHFDVRVRVPEPVLEEPKEESSFSQISLPDPSSIPSFIPVIILIVVGATVAGILLFGRSRLVSRKLTEEDMETQVTELQSPTKEDLSVHQQTSADDLPQDSESIPYVRLTKSFPYAFKHKVQTDITSMKSKKTKQKKKAHKKKTKKTKHKSKHKKHRKHKKRKETKDIEIEAKKLHKDQYFYAQDGQVIKDIRHLAPALEMMDEATFRHHANEHRNDFANWVEYVYGSHEFAKWMKGKTKEQIIKALR